MALHAMGREDCITQRDGQSLLDATATTNPLTLAQGEECRYKATWKGEFKLPLGKAGPLQSSR